MKERGLKKHDWFLTIAILILVMIGLIVIYSSTFTAETLVEGAGTINRQLVFVILGFFIYFLISNIDPTYYRYFPIQVVMYTIIIGLLLYVWLFGDPIRDTNRWIEWGFIRIQPSEYSKIILVLLNSGILVNIFNLKRKEETNWNKEKSKKKFKDKVKNLFSNIRNSYPSIYVYTLATVINLICILLILIEPALGNAAITGLICLSLYFIVYPKQTELFGLIVILLLTINVVGNFINFSSLYEKLGYSLTIGNIDIVFLIISIVLFLVIKRFMNVKLIKAIIVVALGIIAVFSLSYVWDNVLKEYQQKRIEIFFNPEEDPQGAGWQSRQAKIAIGSGRLLGKGFLQGSQSKLRYLPEAYSDFIFAAYCEEFGLLGASFLLFLYIFLIIRIIRSAKLSSNIYESLICYGVASMILIHVFINTGMNMGILPITGIPLPLISYGGSSIMVTMIGLGIVQSVNIHRDMIDTQESLVVTSGVNTRNY